MEIIHLSANPERLQNKLKKSSELFDGHEGVFQLLDEAVVVVHGGQHAAHVLDDRRFAGIVDFFAGQGREPATHGRQERVAWTDVPLLDERHVDVRILESNEMKKSPIPKFNG